jgi:ABC-type bacteriocin/lantibiotic exporter with double-glycine peptidase domain
MLFFLGFGIAYFIISVIFNFLNDTETEKAIQKNIQFNNCFLEIIHSFQDINLRRLKSIVFRKLSKHYEKIVSQKQKVNFLFIYQALTTRLLSSLLN